MLGQVGRTDSGYRQYTSADVHTLRFIRRSRDLGFALDQVRRLLQLADDRFVRMWRFYLVGAEQTFRHGGHAVFQIQLARRQEAVPLTRAYLADAITPERERMAAE